MEPEPLFLRRCERAAMLIVSPDEVDLLDVAALLRQLLMDKHSLLDTVNVNRIKPQFYVRELSPLPTVSMQLVIHVVDDGLDPEAFPGAKVPAVTLTRDQFLQHVVMRVRGDPISVKDIIDYAANIAGGVHHDPKKRNHALAEFGALFTVDNLPLGIRQLRAICRIALRSLDPIIEDVKTRANAPQPVQTPSLDKSGRPAPE